MKRVLKWLDDNLEAALASVFLCAMVLFTFIQVLGRHILSAPFPWTEELTRYMFVWMVFIAVGYAVKSDSHIRITILRMFLKPKGKILFDLFADAMSLVFAAACMVVGAGIMSTIAKGGQTAVSVVFLPMWMVYLAMPLGFLLYCVRLLQNMVHKVCILKAGAGDASATRKEG